MPKLVIDDQNIEVAPGTKVIEAATQIGIMIPRFCFHPALGSVGACRVCAVKFLEGPVKGVQMSCMIEAKDDMVVSTTDAEAMDFRKHVIEWLMLNHPHDCPVCDEGGHCLLQDMTVSGGHGMRRFSGNKRTYQDQYLGPLVQHEMNRCIHCYRCSRYYQEFSGYRDLGVMRSASHTYFGRFQEGILESPFSGNLSDICPTGVYTDKPSRFFGRRWDYQRSPSVCIHCSLGCHTVASVRYREIRRQEARFSNAVNGYFICDRGRYGLFYASLESRPRHALVDGDATSHDQAVQAASESLGKIGRDFGTSAIAAFGSVRSSLETQAMLSRLCQLMGWRNPAYFMDPIELSKVRTAITRLDTELVVSLQEVEKADFILSIGADPINEAPMLAMAMRQAQRNGAKIAVMDPRPVALPLDFQHLNAPLKDLDGLVGSVIKATVDGQTMATMGADAVKFYDSLPDRNQIAGYQEDWLTAVTEGIKSSQRPVIVCGTDIPPVRVPAIAADLALLLRAADKNAGLFYLLPGANAFGAGLLSDEEQSMLSIVEAIENGDVKALVIVESDPFFHFSDRKRLVGALDALDLLIVLDYLDSEVVQKAQVFIPSTTVYETGGIFVNQEGRAQMVRPAYSGGLPIVQSGGGDHPPRVYGTGIPGADPKPAWLTLVELANDKLRPEKHSLQEAIYQCLAEMIPEMADVDFTAGLPDEGFRINSAARPDSQIRSDFSGRPYEKTENSGKLSLILTDMTFGSEVLSAHSECLRELEPEPAVMMHTQEADSLGLVDGDSVTIQTESGNFAAKLGVVENMATGVLVVPRHRKTTWQIFAAGVSGIGREQIQKAD